MSVKFRNHAAVWVLCACGLGLSGKSLAATEAGSITLSAASGGIIELNQGTGAQAPAPAAPLNQGVGTGLQVTSAASSSSSSSSSSAMAASAAQNQAADTTVPASAQIAIVPADRTATKAPASATMPAGSLRQAAVPADSYNITVPLGDSLDAAFLQGFTDVTSRLSAGAFAPDITDAQEALEQARISADGLQLSFNLGTVDNLLKRQGVAAWQGLDNPVIVWMADYSLSDGSLVSGQNMSSFAQSLNQAAENFSLRLMYPLMDLDDVLRVNEAVVLSRNDAQLADASARYGADYILTAAVSGSADVISVKWNLLDKDGKQVGSASLDGVSTEVAQTMAGDVARTLAQAVSGSTAAVAGAQTPELADPRAGDPFALGPYQGLVRVRILGADNLADLAAIRRTLIIYGYEDSVAVSAVQGDSLIVEIPSNSDPAILDGTMARAQDFSKEGAWTYRWLKSAGASSGYGRNASIGAPRSASAGSVSKVRITPAPVPVPAANVTVGVLR